MEVNVVRNELTSAKRQPAKWRSLSDAQRLVGAHRRAAGEIPFDPTDEAEMRVQIGRILPDEIVQFLA